MINCLDKIQIEIDEEIFDKEVSCVTDEYLAINYFNNIFINKKDVKDGSDNDDVSPDIRWFS